MIGNPEETILRKIREILDIEKVELEYHLIEALVKRKKADKKNNLKGELRSLKGR